MSTTTRTGTAATSFTPNPELFPFESKWFESSVGPVHYIDEGAGRPLLLMHGNPDWSFLYRKMIPLLTPHFRTISLDYPGFGLSPHPDEYDYLPSSHAAIVAELVEHLDLHNTVLVGQDWGGPIGMDAATRMPERFTGLVAGNTMLWSSRPFFLQRNFSRVMGTRFMQRTLMKRHLFAKRLMPTLLQVDVSDEEMRHYLDVAPAPADRRGHAVFPKAILGEDEWLVALEARMRTTVGHLPMLRITGMKDAALASKAYMRKWDEMWPDATVLDLPKAGHYWQEDDPDAAATAIIRAYGA